MKALRKLCILVGGYSAVVVLFAQFSGPAPILPIVREYGFITCGGWTINSSNLWRARLDPEEVARLRQSLESDGWTCWVTRDDFSESFTTEYDLHPQTGDIVCHKKLREEDYLCHILLKPDGLSYLLAFSCN